MLRSSDENDPLEYNIENDKAIVVGVNYITKKDVVIPETVILNENTYKVTSISPKAFYENTFIKNITIPASITLIGDEAFKDSNLNKVYFNGDKPIIGKDVFKNESNSNLNFNLYGYVNNKLKGWEGVNKIDDLTINNMSLKIKRITSLIISLIIYFTLIYLFSKIDMHLGFKIPLYISIISYLTYLVMFFDGKKQISPIIHTVILIFLYLITKIPIIWLKIPLFILLNIPNLDTTVYGMVKLLNLPDNYITLFT